MADVERHLKAVIDAEDNASAKLKSISENLSQVGKYATIAGGAIVTELGFAVKAAADAELANSQFNASLQKTAEASPVFAKNLGAITEHFNKTADAAVKLGFSDEEVRLSLANLSAATGDAELALQGNALAMDLARARGIDLESAQKAIGLAMQGSTKLLNLYGIELADGADKTAILDALSAKFGGTAQATAGTLAVQTKVLQESFGNLQEQIGAVLLPILTDLLKNYIMPIIDQIIKWTQAHPELTKNIVLIAAAIGGLLVVVGPLLIMLPGLIAFFGLLTGPIALVIGAVLALIVAGTLLIANWESVVAFGKKIWGDLLLNINAIIAGIVAAFNGLWESIKSIWAGITGTISGAIDSIMSKINAVISAISNVTSAAGRIASAPVKAVSSVFKKFADGGVVTKPTLGLIGESGPEAVIPLRNGGAGMGSQTIVITGNTFMSGEEAAVKIGDMIANRLKFNLKIAS